MKDQDFKDFLISIAQARRINKVIKNYNYSWGDFTSDISRIKETVDFKKFNTLVEVSKGGLALGIKLANISKLPLKIVFANSYKNKKRKELIVEQFYPMTWKAPILLVDDIADTGETLAYIKTELTTWSRETEVLTLFYKPHSIVKPDYYFNKIGNKVWVNFPWEK